MSTVKELYISNVMLILQHFKLLNEVFGVSNNLFIENKQVGCWIDRLLDGIAHWLDEIFVVFVFKVDPRKYTIISPLDEKGQVQFFLVYLYHLWKILFRQDSLYSSHISSAGERSKVEGCADCLLRSQTLLDLRKVHTMRHGCPLLDDFGIALLRRLDKGCLESGTEKLGIDLSFPRVVIPVRNGSPHGQFSIALDRGAHDRLVKFFLCQSFSSHSVVKCLQQILFYLYKHAFEKYVSSFYSDLWLPVFPQEYFV